MYSIVSMHAQTCTQWKFESHKVGVRHYLHHGVVTYLSVLALSLIRSSQPLNEWYYHSISMGSSTYMSLTISARMGAYLGYNFHTLYVSCFLLPLKFSTWELSRDTAVYCSRKPVLSGEVHRTDWRVLITLGDQGISLIHHLPLHKSPIISVHMLLSPMCSTSMNKIKGGWVGVAVRRSIQKRVVGIIRYIWG